ncbi:hypothetical protein CI109_106891 [Kwoniella shandongensis]|uniref:Uncharacterized protein n=1 Tax=Kwoniella shandongensis TaxID=1734106 RepID=A0A5M6C6M1_9TREE|nr:uncharacterized protein CI109_000853 [Kwoniella shandongensis]KAA5530673.1 hypothetical protein CI109_000853 [Kwoniella shandongensis]
MPAVKREYTPSGSDNGSELDIKPSLTPPPKSKKAKTAKATSSTASSAKKTQSPKKNNSTLSDGEKKMGAWSVEELKLLYTIMAPKRTGVNWNDVAGQIPGREAKSCVNKWTRMQGKILELLEAMGQ